MPTTRTLAEVLADFADSPPKNVLAAELRDFAFSVAFLTDLLAHRNDAAPHPAYDPGADLTAHIAGGDPHTVYQKESERDVANGYAGLDAGGLVPDAKIAATIARDSEVTTAVSNHAAASDPHTGYASDTDLSDHVAASDPHSVYLKESDVLAVPTFKSGEWYGPLSATSLAAASGYTLVSGVVRAVPFFARDAALFSDIGIDVTTISTGTHKVRLGILTDNGGLTPLTLMAGTDVAELDTSTTGLKSNTFAANKSLRGLFWLILLGNSNAVIRGIPPGAAPPLLGHKLGGGEAVGTNLGYSHWEAAKAYGALVDWTGAGMSGQVKAIVAEPLIALKAV